MAGLYATAFMSASSIVMLGYWLRYVCLLILTAKTPRDYARECAMTNKLSFPQVRSKLRNRAIRNFDSLHECLDRDYTFLTYLLEVTTPSNAEHLLDGLILSVYYHLLSTLYILSRRFSASVAFHAVEEMSMVVEYFANAMGARATWASSI